MKKTKQNRNQNQTNKTPNQTKKQQANQQKTPKQVVWAIHFLRQG